MNYLFGVLYCIFYGGTSLSFSLIVKDLVKLYNFHQIFILLLGEALINIIICIIMGYRTHTSKTTIIYSLLQAVQTYCGMKGLMMINIPMYMTLRTLILFIVVIQQEMNLSKIMAVLFITSGAVFAGSQHFEQNQVGYILIIIANILKAITLQLAKQLHTERMTPLHLLFQNSCNQLPFYFIGAYIFGEFQEISTFDDYAFGIYFGIAAFLGFMLNYSTNLCAMLNSPFALAITHNILITTSSILLFKKELQLDMQSIVGLSVSYVGSIFYTAITIDEASQFSQKLAEVSYYNDEESKLIQQV